MKLARQRLTHHAISGVIVVILGTQTFVSIVGLGGAGWPIIHYPMYSGPKYEGARLNHGSAVSAVLEDSSEIDIDPDEMHIGFWDFHYQISQPIIDNAQDVLTPAMRDLCRRWDNKIVALKARDLGVAITRQGVIELPPIELGKIDVTCAGGSLR